MPVAPFSHISPIPLGYPTKNAFLASIPGRGYSLSPECPARKRGEFHCTTVMCRPFGVGGVTGGGEGGGGGGTGIVVMVNVTGTVTEEAPTAFIVTVPL